MHTHGVKPLNAPKQNFSRGKYCTARGKPSLHNMRTRTISVPIHVCDTVTDGTSTTSNETVNEILHLMSSSSVACPLLFVLSPYISVLLTSRNYLFWKYWVGGTIIANPVLRPRMFYNLHMYNSFKYSLTTWAYNVYTYTD